MEIEKMNKKINEAVKNIWNINNAIPIKKEELRTLQAKRHNNEKWLKQIFKNRYKDKIINCYWYGEPRDECYVIFTKSKEDAIEITKEIDALSYKIDEPLSDGIYVLSLYL